MIKSIVLSIKSQHALNIMDGYKTLELRKRVPKGFVGWVYVYVTKTEPYLHHRPTENCDTHYVMWDKKSKENLCLNGTIPFRFWFDEYDIIEVDSEQHNAILKKVCLTVDEIIEYCKGKDLYAWHIKQLEIFDKPKSINDFVSFTKANKIFQNQIYGKSIFGNSINCKHMEFRRLENTIGFYGCKLQKDWEKDCDWEYCPLCKSAKAPQSYQYVYLKEVTK